MIYFEHVCPSCKGSGDLHNPTEDDYGNTDVCEDCDGDTMIYFSLTEDEIQEMVGYVIDGHYESALRIVDKEYLK